MLIISHYIVVVLKLMNLFVNCDNNDKSEGKIIDLQRIKKKWHY